MNGGEILELGGAAYVLTKEELEPFMQKTPGPSMDGAWIYIGIDVDDVTDEVHEKLYKAISAYTANPAKASSITPQNTYRQEITAALGFPSSEYEWVGAIWRGGTDNPNDPFQKGMGAYSFAYKLQDGVGEAGEGQRNLYWQAMKIMHQLACPTCTFCTMPAPIPTPSFAMKG